MTLIRFSTGMLPERDRAPMFQDVIGQRVINTEMIIARDNPRPFYFDMALALGPRLKLAEVDFAAVATNRGPREVRDGDDGITCFIPTGAPVRSDHRGHRGVIGHGGAVVISHATPGRSFWPDNHVTMLMLPRTAFAEPDVIDRAAGRPHAPGRPLLKLLRAYIRSAWADAAAGSPLSEGVEQTVIDLLAGLSAHTPDGMRRAAWPALGQARIAAMREVIARRSAEPGLGMTEVAAAVGLSERSGHLLFAKAGLGFTDCMAEVRLARVRARLEAGDPGRILDIALDAGFGDVTHFNRLFRRRFGTTPTDMRGRGRSGGDDARRADPGPTPSALPPGGRHPRSAAA
jgi:AraC-like DNA-binding protein